MRAARALLPVLVLLGTVAVLLATVFPTRTWLDQRRSLARAEEQLAVLGTENDRLEARAELLSTDAEIERLAREQYNLVRPGEEAYAVLPPPAPPPVPPPAPPDEGPSLLERAWDAANGML